MMKTVALFFFVGFILALASIHVVDAATLRASEEAVTKKEADRGLQITSIQWPPPYLRAYKQTFPEKNIQRCSAFLEKNGFNDPPDEGLECPKRQHVGDYTCLIGTQTCDSRSLPHTETHPQKICSCDVSTGKLTCQKWEPCEVNSTPIATPARARKLPRRKPRWNPPPFWLEYKNKYPDFNLQPCLFLERRGIDNPSDEGTACDKRKADYTCTIGSQECAASELGLNTQIHPERVCKCDVESKMLTCSDWEPCDAEDQLPAVTEPAPEVVDCPAGPFVTTESDDDASCKDLKFMCEYPLVHWYKEGCGCGCEPKAGTLIHETCPVEMPETGELCRVADTCKYDESCCCGECWQPTRCTCENGHFDCETMLPGCIHPCEPGDGCGGAEDKPCQAGLQCVDDSSDSCNPLDGDADCAGICVLDSCPEEDAGFTYVHIDIFECESTPYKCASDEEAWSQEQCGCGCKKASPVVANDVGVVDPLSLGHADCPATSHEAMDEQLCLVDLNCSWGEEICCGKTHKSFRCMCDAGEQFGCMYTDACMMPYCADNCPADEPNEGDTCESSDFGGWWDWMTQTVGKCKYGNALDCSCSVEPMPHEKECQCVDDTWTCKTTGCGDICVEIAVDFLVDGTEGSYCGTDFPCNEGFECVDDPDDGCDPIAGAVDCGGYCAPTPAFDIDPMPAEPVPVTECPMQKPQLGDSCAVEHVCTYGTTCGCGDDKQATFECMNGSFELSPLSLMTFCLGPTCPEDDRNFPWFLEGKTCQESGGLGEDCHCSCGAPCGPDYWCECTDDGTYSCRKMNNHNLMCACAAPPVEYSVTVDEDGNVVEEEPVVAEIGTCPDAPPTTGTECDMPNHRCGYDEVCGTNTTSYVCNQWNKQWGQLETWIPDCPPPV